MKKKKPAKFLKELQIQSKKGGQPTGARTTAFLPIVGKVRT